MTLAVALCPRDLAQGVVEGQAQDFGRGCLAACQKHCASNAEDYLRETETDDRISLIKDVMTVHPRLSPAQSGPPEVGIVPVRLAERTP